MGLTEKVAIGILILFVVGAVLRLFKTPLKLAMQVLLNTLLGFGTLFLLNLTEAVTGISLCAKFRRGALSTKLNALGISKIALGHHYDDAVETMLMSLFIEGRISCFQPVTYLDRTQVTQIRPLLYVQEREVRGAVKRLGLPVVENPCPANGSTKREEMKELIRSLDQQFPGVKKRIFGAIQRYPLYGWSTEELQR